MSDYENILSKGWDNIPQPKQLPEGSYLLVSRGASIQAPTKEGGNPNILFVHSVKEAMDDVDDGDLKKLGDGYDFSLNRIFTRVWLETAADYSGARAMLKKHGVDTSGDDYKEAFKDLRGKEIVAFLTPHSFVNNAGDEVQDNRASNFVPANAYAYSQVAAQRALHTERLKITAK